MTNDEAIAIAKRACEEQGWRWHDPTYVQMATAENGNECWWVASEDLDDPRTKSIAPDYMFQIDGLTGEILCIGSNIR